MRGSVLVTAVLAAASLSCMNNSNGTGHVLVRVSSLVTTVQITRVALDVDPAGVREDLTYDPADGSFSGVVTVPAGPQTLTARAYAGTRVAGTGTAAANVPENQSVQVQLRILDSTGGGTGPDHAPVVTSLVVPETVVMATPASVSVGAVDTDGDPLTYAWTDHGCGGAFASPAGSSTTWSRGAVGTCVLSASATAKGLSDSASASIRVLLTPQGTGRVDVTGVYIPNPTLQRLQISSGAQTLCSISRTQTDATCRTTAPGGAPLRVQLSYDLGTTAVGTITAALSDGCGGTARLVTSSTAAATFDWTPPTAPTVCLLTGRIDHDGLSDSLPVAVPTGCVDDAYEPNDAVTTAAKLAIGPGSSTSVSGLYAHDQDWFELSPSAAGSVTVTATGADTLRLELFDAAYQLVGSGSGSLTATVAAGTYLLHVPPGASAPTCGSSYALSITSP